jgi:acyl-CoA synthetase (AMP-forming)/AMP-acid ligase II
MPIESLVHLLRMRAAAQPGRCAYTLLGDGESPQAQLTYDELDARARTFAARIRGRAEPGEAVILAYAAGLDFIAAFFGCLYAGVVAVPVGPVPQRTSVRHRRRLRRDWR